MREQGAGLPLLMINGMGTNVERWGRAELELAASARTIVFDCPGTGRSETPLWPRSLPALAELVVALLDELGHARVDVLGFSFGVSLAQQLVKDAPARIRRLALVSTSCGWGAMPGARSAWRRHAAGLRSPALGARLLVELALAQQGADADARPLGPP